MGEVRRMYGPPDDGSPNYGTPNDEPTGELPPVPPRARASDHAPQHGWTFDQQPTRYGAAPPPPPPQFYGPDPLTYQVPAAEPSWWRRNAVAVVSGIVSLLVIVGVGWILIKPDGQPTPVSAAGSPTPSQSPSVAPTSEAPSPTPSPTPAPTTQSRAPTVVEVPTEKPPPAELPPAPPPQIPDTPDCVQHPGPDAPPDEVSAALTAAGNKQYWKNVKPPDGLTGPVPTITMSANLMKAVAWAESSWRSTVIACDHGIGLMQVMPDTAAWMNQRFGTNYDPHSVAGNAALGAEYLEWLTMYFGLFYFGNFDLNAQQPVGDNGATLRLRDVVIAAYNVGYQEIENLNDPANETDDTLSIPNQWYVDRVTGYITNCPCPTV
jgi:Transglycosylase SLT domain